MPSLYDLGQAYNAIYEQIYTDVPIEEIEAALMAVTGMFEEKADAYAKIIRSINADCEQIKTEEQRLSERRKSLENKADSLKKGLEEQMVATGKDKFKTTLFSFNIQNNPPSLKVDEENNELKTYQHLWIKQKPKFDKAKAKDEIKNGATIPGCELVQTRGLRIR